jgi:hypothetical protein
VSLALPLGVAAFFLTRAIQRAQERHHYRIWRGTAERVSRHARSSMRDHSPFEARD